MTQRERNLKRYWTDPERERQYARNHRLVDPQKHKEIHQRSYIKHQDARRAGCRAYYCLHRDAIIQRTLRNKRLNRLRCRATEAKRRARANASCSQYTRHDVAVLFRAQLRACYWCGQKLTTRYEVDHVQPLAKGGSNGPENIVLSCRSCNRRKGTQDVAAFLQRQAAFP